MLLSFAGRMALCCERPNVLESEPPGPLKKLVRIIVLAALVAVVAIFVKRQLAQGPASDGPLMLYGNVEIRQVALGFRVPGRIESMATEEGDAAAKGDVIAVLDKGPLGDSVALFKAQVAVAQAGVAKLEAGTRPGEIAQVQARVEELQTALTNAEETLARVAQLAQTGAASKQAADDAKSARDAALARLESARQAHALAVEGPRAEDIAISRAELAAAQAQLAQADRQLADAELIAPADGIILTRVAEPGAIVAAGATVYTLSLRQPVWVRTYISEPDLGRIHPGMKVKVITDSRPDQPYQGQIGFISPLAEFTPKSVETAELRTDLVYRLRVIIEQPDDALRQGMPVTVQLPR